MKHLFLILICLVGGVASGLDQIRSAEGQTLESRAKACSGKRALVKITGNDSMGYRGVLQALGTKRRSKRVNPPLEVILVSQYTAVIGTVWEGFISFDKMIVETKSTAVRKGKELPIFRGVPP